MRGCFSEHASGLPAAYYLLAVEPQEADRDGKMHRIQVKVDTRTGEYIERVN